MREFAPLRPAQPARALWRRALSVLALWLASVPLVALPLLALPPGVVPLAPGSARPGRGSEAPRAHLRAVQRR
jgi:hypothetical protein